MRITSVMVDGAGPFGAPVTVEGLGDGVNILAAGNEAGKSTIFKAMRVCLFERHKTSNRAVVDLCTEGLSLPLSVRLGFTHDGHDFIVAKTFVRSPSASLIRDGTEIARGRQADELLWEILGIQPGSGRSVDEAAFGLLWVSQGESFEKPTLAGAAADTLSAIVEAEVGTLVGGERARDVLKKIKAELDQQLTDGGKPKTNGLLRRAIGRVESLTSQTEEMRQRLQLADDNLATLERLTSERTTLTDPGVLAKMQADLEGAGVDLERSKEAQIALAKAELAECQASGALQVAVQASQTLTDCATRIDGGRARESVIDEEIGSLNERSSVARKIHQEARAAQDKLDAHLKIDEGAESALKLLASAHTAIQKRDGLAIRLKTLEGVSRQLGPVDAELSANKTTADANDKLDALERERGQLKARLEAGAARLDIRVGDADRSGVRIDGVPAKGEVTLSVLRTTVVTVGDLATVTASPPAAFGRAEYDRLKAIESQVASLVCKAGLLSVEQFRESYARRRRLEDDRTAVLTQLRVLGVPRGDLATEIARLGAEVATLDDQIDQALKTTGRAKLPSTEVIEQELQAISTRRAEARREHQRQAGIADAQSEILVQVAKDIGALDGELKEIRRGREADLASLPDGGRANLFAKAVDKVEKAKRQHGLCAAALLAQRKITPTKTEIERLRNRIDRLRQAIEGQRAKVGGLEREIARLEGLVSAIGAEGLGEKVAEMAEELDLCERERYRLQSHVSLLQLLRETIECSYREQSQKLNAPIMRRLQPYLNDLFPSAAPEFGDNFGLTAVARDGAPPERYDRLSDGTREQIAVLVRLAMGSMICEHAEPVPIILDDALVFSDDDRIERMFDALNRAGQRQQVIVLTCRMRAFAGLGGRQLSLSR
ncbi:MAG: hypothetical protein ABI306_10550 [Caulobacteraceae bacterium]